MEEIQATLDTEQVRRKSKWRKKWEYVKKFWPLYAMLLPLLLYLFIFNYYPMFGLQLAFKDWFVRKGIWGSPWATTDGAIDIFKHFRELFFGEGTEFWVKFGNTIRISLLKTEKLAR